jgi:hypothetical protein
VLRICLEFGVCVFALDFGRISTISIQFEGFSTIGVLAGKDHSFQLELMVQ